MRKELRRRSEELRRGAVLAAMQGALFTTRPLPPQAAIALGAALGAAAGTILPLRLRLLRNMELGLGRGRVPPDAARNYFRNLGMLLGSSMAVYHRGFWRSTVPERMEFHESVRLLDDAVARGHGVVLASPHVFCHEIGAALINGRHKVAALVRESRSPRREAMKRHWYEATGLGVVYRPRRSTLLEDTMACMRVLKEKRVLAITPDLVVQPSAGVPVRMFGRNVHLSPGMVVLASRMRAPLITAYPYWEEGRKPLVRFTEPIEYPPGGDRRQMAVEGLQAWCRMCEERFRAHPGDWMFWLDKRWARVLRSSQPTAEPEGLPG